ncbi:MAG: MucB/RseB C-terminal domain-containing protein [Gammaproteobacteria bacterium]|nr:MucB/RseB C-terminal domain-containing protein [Gammaproteobacteria bacterium]MCW8911437.1 MucB/RseB C-terminal domain-containing protein [Gammaproteobacteria bacterium]MCW9004548.1 MucB/RseB C-terminal domain-containing protein [Gammaproteobacteria bacterium]MCW9055967.1 MucB/RseB C-terminal domain-containing protein [Gammaproteobacteria bacterium]
MNLSRLFFLSGLVFTGLVHASDVDVWLNKMTHAMEMNNYQGTLIIRQADKVDALFVQHGIDKSGIWESLEFLNGESRKVIRKKDTVKTIFPERELVTISHEIEQNPFHPQLPKNLSNLKQYYDIQLAGQDRIARKNAQILEIKPKDKFRYGFKFWLDMDTGLLLKCDLMDSTNKVVEQLMFSELTVLNKAPELLPESEYKGFQSIDLDLGRHQQAVNIWNADQLPDGFMLTRSSTKPGSAGGLVHQMVYSDGIASVSVFVEKQMSAQKALNGISKMGAVNAFGMPVNGHQVTVIGEVPVDTVRLIGQSIRYTQ